MNLQVLISTMHQDDYSLLEKMNINSDAIVINQCDRYEMNEFLYKENSIKWYSFNERGVGLSRNTALGRATQEICLFSDDDVEYVDNYETIICTAFKKNPQADIIIFNLPEANGSKNPYLITKNKKLKLYNSYRYGTPQIAFRLDSVQKANISFSLLFGGGAKYSMGEDSMFLRDSFKKGLKLYSSTETIGFLSNEESTWFKGYTERYFIDRGVLYAALSPKMARLLCLRFAIKHRKMFEKDKSSYQAYRFMKEGIKEWRK